MSVPNSSSHQPGTVTSAQQSSAPLNESAPLQSSATEPSSNDKETNGTTQAVSTQPDNLTQDTVVDVDMHDAPSIMPNTLENTMGESKIPNKKDATLREFLNKMDEHAPIIPDAVSNYYFTLAGLPPPPATPQPLARLLALAAQKFIADVAADAYQYSRIRASTATAAMPGMPQPTHPGTVPTTQGAKEGASFVEKGKEKNAIGVQRAGFGGGGPGGQGRTVLTMEDLGMAVGEYGVNVRRGEFYR